MILNRRVTIGLCFVLAVFMFVSVAPLFAQDEIVLPGDVPVFGGLSLSLSMTLIVGLLTYFKIIKPENKKFIGIILAVIGLAAAGVYAYQTGLRDEQLLKMAFAGVFIGLGSVGLHSTGKNLLQGILQKVAKGLK